MSTTVSAAVFPRLYRDSVTLMALAAQLEKLPGITRAGAVMATPGNLAILARSEMVPADLSAAPDDLLVVVRGETEDEISEALAKAADGLTSSDDDSGAAGGAPRPATIAEAIAGGAKPTLATISVPGTYAAVVAEQALRAGLHVFCFSDNVSVEEEVRLKTYASDNGLLLMGPDCGTAILDGVPLGFANVVRSGPVGIVAASGTGAQEVSVLLDAWEVGVSQVIGVGGRDLSVEVGGLMTHLALGLLADDPENGVLMIVSKPPAAAVAEVLLARLNALASHDRPVVACLLGAEDEGVLGTDPVLIRGTLEGGAIAAARLAGGDPQPVVLALAGAGGTGGILGLYTGGTLASEAKILLARAGLKPAIHDLGDDQYTAGKPHPMIDPSPRNAWIADLAEDAELGVLLVDVVLGYGSHRDPAGSLADAVTDLQRRRAEAGLSPLCVVASVTGTEADPQRRSSQVATLLAAGIEVAESNAAAVRAVVQSWRNVE
ncbi:MAG: acyl-CoA synthetase FdrA [Micropruina sp.]|nr:acyl-CoA synthetase FdrA [Micropruina sp.]